MEKKLLIVKKGVTQACICISCIRDTLDGIILKYKVSKVGTKPIVKGKMRVKNKGEITIGNNFLAKNIPLTIFIFVYPKAKLSIGDNVFINSGVDIRCTNEINIGNNVLIGQNSSISDTNFHLVEPNNVKSNQSIVISDNVWIAQRCIILPGVHIGKNSVIAAGSVVTMNVPDNVLVAGAPAKILRKLNIPANWSRRS